MKSLRACSISVFLSVTVLLAALFGNRVLAQSPMRAAGNSCPVTWQDVIHPDVGTLHSVDAIAQDDVWVAGDSNLLHWNGESWDTISNPSGQSLQLLRSSPSGGLWGKSSDTLWHWDGAAWQQVGTESLYSTDIAVLAPDDIWATQYAGVSHWDGSHWQGYWLPDTYEVIEMNSLTAVAPDKVWVAGSVGHLHSAKSFFWDGTQWTLASELGDVPSYYWSISASSLDNVWVIGFEPNFQSAERFDGTTWTGHNPPNGWFHAVKALAPDDVYIVGDAILHWDGDTWSVLAIDQALEEISASSATDLWAVGGAVLKHGMLPCATPLTPTPTPLPTPTDIPCLVTQPELIHPKDKVTLPHAPISVTWQQQECANRYKIAIRKGSVHGKKLLHTAVTSTRYNAGWLGAGREYFWRVQACNVSRCGKWSEWRSFTIQR